jgi:hypothetical protein
MIRRDWAIIMAAGVASGCELIAGVDDKYLVGAPDASIDAPATADSAFRDASPEEVTSPPPNDAGVVDAPSDSPPDVASPPPDDAGVADPSVPCSSQGTFLFCDDFDFEATVGQNWTYTLISADGGTLDFFSGAYTSPSRSMRASTPPTTGRESVMLGRDVGMLGKQFRLAFDLRVDVDTYESLPRTTVAQVNVHRATRNVEFDYQVMPPGAAQVQAFFPQPDGGTNVVSIPLPAPALRQWARIVLAYDSTAGITVLQDGQTIGANATTAGSPDLTQFQMGMVYQIPPGTEALQLELDNVVFRGL